MPIGLQTCGALFGPHMREPGMHDPEQLPLEHRFAQGALGTHFPFSSQVSGVRFALPPQRFSLGLHSPVQVPAPVQTNGQDASGVHSPASLQCSGVWSCPQCFAFGWQVPVHTPKVQLESHVSLRIQVAAFVQTSTFAPLAEHRVSPVVQSGVTLDCCSASDADESCGSNSSSSLIAALLLVDGELLFRPPAPSAATSEMHLPSTSVVIGGHCSRLHDELSTLPSKAIPAAVTPNWNC